MAQSLTEPLKKACKTKMLLKNPTEKVNPVAHKYRGWDNINSPYVAHLPERFFNPESFEGVKEGFCDPRNLLTFSNISDLDSEDEFVNNLINFPSEGESEQFAVACLPSPPASASEDEKKSRIDSRSRKFTAPMNVSARASAQRSRVKRRGRKPSLTEDPSKTFVCNLCNHRFRRQEHLKRHHLSLHTQEKPFECHKCRKTFSRSDRSLAACSHTRLGELPAGSPNSASSGKQTLQAPWLLLLQKSNKASTTA